MAIDKLQLALLKKLMQEDGWDVLVDKLLMERITKLEAQEVTGSNAFETLRELFKKQGAIEELKQFFDDIQKLNFGND